jgi:protein-S-isoprenylcysteine O-methyltransferase Ste14
MSAARTSQLQSKQIDRDTTTRIGGWLFRQRTLIPIPITIALLGLRVGETASSAGLLATGVAVTLAGEMVRLSAVHHIGVISRTRSDRLGPLVASGPFALVRNPLYVGNIALWAGFAIIARLVWMAPVIIVLLGAEYHLIVRWEERLLESRLGDAYRAYAARVPRWLPTFTTSSEQLESTYSWRETLFSERGTLVAIAVGYLLLWIKTQV